MGEPKWLMRARTISMTSAFTLHVLIVMIGVTLQQAVLPSFLGPLIYLQPWLLSFWLLLHGSHRWGPAVFIPWIICSGIALGVFSAITDIALSGGGEGVLNDGILGAFSWGLSSAGMLYIAVGSVSPALSGGTDRDWWIHWHGLEGARAAVSGARAPYDWEISLWSGVVAAVYSIPSSRAAEMAGIIHDATFVGFGIARVVEGLSAALVMWITQKVLRSDFVHVSPIGEQGVIAAWSPLVVGGVLVTMWGVGSSDPVWDVLIGGGLIVVLGVLGWRAENLLDGGTLDDDEVRAAVKAGTGYSALVDDGLDTPPPEKPVPEAEEASSAIRVHQASKLVKKK